MEKRNVAIILDPAHGEETPGKRSPDGRHREYRWSRERLNNIAPVLEDLGFEVYWTNTTQTEIGLSKRVAAADAVKTNCKYKLLVSLHNNGAGSGSEWMTATGIEIFTTKGTTTSDDMAQIMLDSFKKVFSYVDVIPKLNYSSINYRGLKEANFTVLTGKTYNAMLIECMFQDNKKDVEYLEDKDFNDDVERAVIDGLVSISNKYK